MAQTRGAETNALRLRSTRANRTTPQDAVISSLEKAFPALAEREQEILRRRFGMTGSPPQPLVDIAASNPGWTAARVRQLEGQATHRLGALLVDR
jgi:DNA-directed RNA polymerase sigma subunit (sigma70/sigma32)